MPDRSHLPSASPGARILAFGIDASVMAAWAGFLAIIFTGAALLADGMETNELGVGVVEAHGTWPSGLPGATADPAPGSTPDPTPDAADDPADGAAPDPAADGQAPAGAEGLAGRRGHALGFLALTLPALLYLALFEAFGRGATPGKRWLRIRVVRALPAPLPATSRGGDAPSFPAALGRAGLRLLPWELAHASLWRIPGWPDQATHLPPGPLAGLVLVWLLVGLYAWTLLTGQDGQALWDRFTGTRVVAAPAPPPRLR